MKKYHRNPIMGIDGSAVKPIVSAIAGNLATTIIPNLGSGIWTGFNQGYTGYLAQGIIGAAGTFGANRYFGKDAAIGFASGALISILTTVLEDYAPTLEYGVDNTPAAPAAAPAATGTSGYDAHMLNGFGKTKSAPTRFNPRSHSKLFESGQTLNIKSV